MEEKLEESLNEIFDINIEVKFEDFNKYQILVYLHLGKVIKFTYKYDNTMTINANVSYISHLIEQEIIKSYRKVG